MVYCLYKKYKRDSIVEIKHVLAVIIVFCIMLLFLFSEMSNYNINVFGLRWCVYIDSC